MKLGQLFYQINQDMPLVKAFKSSPFTVTLRLPVCDNAIVGFNSFGNWRDPSGMMIDYKSICTRYIQLLAIHIRKINGISDSLSVPDFTIEVNLFANDKCYYAEFTDSHIGQRMIELFGSTRIPTPYEPSMNPEHVRNEIQGCNPDHIVVLGYVASYRTDKFSRPALGRA